MPVIPKESKQLFPTSTAMETSGLQDGKKVCHLEKCYHSGFLLLNLRNEAIKVGGSFLLLLSRKQVAGKGKPTNFSSSLTQRLKFHCKGHVFHRWHVEKT